MAILLSRLIEGALRSEVPLAKSITEATNLGLKTAFLCHSHNDATYVQGMVRLLNASGWKVYVDWLDSTMPTAPNRETARKIKDRILRANYFIFLATPNSTSSRWCPWEIGYADGVKSVDSIFLITTRNSSGEYFGNEYLQLYRHLDFAGPDLAIWMPGDSRNGVRLQSL